MNKINLTEDTYTIKLGDTWLLISIEDSQHIIRGMGDRAYTVDDVDTMRHYRMIEGTSMIDVGESGVAVRVWK